MWLSYPHHNTREPWWVVFWVAGTKVYLHQIQSASQVHRWDHVSEYKMIVLIWILFPHCPCSVHALSPCAMAAVPHKDLCMILWTIPLCQGNPKHRNQSRHNHLRILSYKGEKPTSLVQDKITHSYSTVCCYTVASSGKLLPTVIYLSAWKNSGNVFVSEI